MAAEVLPPSKEGEFMPMVALSPPVPVVQMGILQASNPHEFIRSASECASELAAIIRSQKLAVTIQGREFVRVEGWTTLAVMLGLVPREVSTIELDGVYVSTVELVRLTDQAVISRASAECGDEKPWCDRPRYARRSMAITRATGKVCRIVLSWVMKLAGYEACPAEEMPEPPSAPMRDTAHAAPAPALRVLPETITEEQKDRLYTLLEEEYPAVALMQVAEWCVIHNRGSTYFEDLTPVLYDQLCALLPGWDSLERCIAMNYVKRDMVVAYAKQARQVDSLGDLSAKAKEKCEEKIINEWSKDPAWLVPQPPVQPEAEASAVE